MSGVDDYEIERQIGAGASGTVWKAQRRGPVKHTVALKRLRADSSQADLARLRREATVLAELDHPHIVRVVGVLEDGDGLAIAMSLAPGGSLDTLLAERGRLSPGEVVAVAAPIAEALASAHRRSIVHGDVKPANILFTSDGEPLLSDFGVSRTLGKLTSEYITGTATYLDPELFDGAIPDARSDIYSLAVVCYEALAGQPPFTGEVPLAVARAADRGDHRSLVTVPGIPRPLAEVVERAMARDPERRFGSAEILADALRAAVPRDETRLPRTIGSPSREGAISPDETHRPDTTGSSSTDGPFSRDETRPHDTTGAAGTAAAVSRHEAGPPGTTGSTAIAGGPTGPTGTAAGGTDATATTTTFGPRPPRPPVPSPPRRRRVRRPATVAAAAVVVVAGGLILGLRGPFTSASSDECEPSDRGSTTSQPGPSSQADCPEQVTSTTVPDVQRVRGDPEGDGTETIGTYELRAHRNGGDVMVLTIDIDGERNLIGVGEPGDQLFLGDWDCDGADTPGLYKRGDGEVHYFNVWPETRDERYEPDTVESAPPSGNAIAVPPNDDHDCEHLVVVTPS